MMDLSPGTFSHTRRTTATISREWYWRANTSVNESLLFATALYHGGNGEIEPLSIILRGLTLPLKAYSCSSWNQQSGLPRCIRPVSKTKEERRSAPPPLTMHLFDLSPFRQNCRRIESCASRGSPTPWRMKPSKSNSGVPLPLNVFMLFLLLNRLKTSIFGMIWNRSPT